MNTIKLYVILFLTIFATAKAYSNDLLTFPGSKSASIGVYIKNIKTGKVICAQNEFKLLTPASVTKSVTSAGAVLTLDSCFRFHTDVMLVGDTTVYTDSVACDIAIVASGDPTIESSHFPESTGFVDSISVALSRLGINTINGTIYIDSNNVDVTEVSSTWMVEDIAWDYGAELKPFNFRDNVCQVEVNSRNNNNYNGIEIVNDLMVGDKDSIVALRGINSQSLYISGSVADTLPIKLHCSNPDAPQSFLKELKLKLNHDNISLGDASVSAKRDSLLLYTHYSPLRDDILRSLMVRSDNLYAEAMLNALAPQGNRSHYLEALFDSIGLDCSLVDLYDGSGLSRIDRIAPKFLGDLLEYMAMSPLKKSYVNLFPHVGKEGTVKSLLGGTRLSGRLVLKSGSMGGVQCYAGYKLDTKQNPSHVVVVMVNQFTCKSRHVRKAIEKLLLRLL